MNRSHGSGALARRALLVCMGALATWFTHCDYTEYPLQPTFCDDWCRMLLRVDCGQEPENCVRNCENSIAPEACFELQEELLACYQVAPASDFVCAGQGFQASARPEEWVCPAERDALIECAYPEVKVCLDVCRTFDTAVDAGAPESQTCPSLDVPCDSICWAAQSYLASSELDASLLADLAPAIFECAVERAESCRSGATTEDATWASVLLECAEELAG